QQPEDPERGMDRADDPAAVERDHRQQVEEVDEEAEEGDRLQRVRALGRADRVDDGGPEGAEQRSSECELELSPGAFGVFFQEDAGAEEWEDEGRAAGQPRALRLEPVAHLVNEDQPDQADREPEPAEPEVGAERDEQPEQELVLEDPDAELGDESGHGGERCPDLAADLAPVRAARLDRLVVAKALRELARLVGGGLWR